jgi:rubredoxin
MEMEEEGEYTMFPLIQYRDEIIRLEEMYQRLPIVFQCPFCGYVSEKPMDVKVKAEVYYSGWPYEDVIKEEEVDYCMCPRCRSPPKKHYNADELGKIKSKKLVVITREYRAFREKVEEMLRSELEYFDCTDEISYRGWSEEDLCDYPLVLRLVRIVWFRIISQPSNVIHEEDLESKMEGA